MQSRRIQPTEAHGFLMLALLALALLASPAAAHEVHDHEGHDDHVEESANRANHETARSLLQAFRETGDDAHLDRAWSLVEPRLQREPPDPELLIDAALVAQARHRFDTALELTRAALAVDRQNDQAWLLLASIHLVTGDTRAAKSACDELTRSPWLIIVGCEARVAHANGEAATVRPMFERLLSVTDETRVDAGTLAWALSVAGDLAVATNDMVEAISFFNRSLVLAESAQVRSALVDVLLAGDRLADAELVLENGSDALPLELRRLILAKRQGRSAAVAARVVATDRSFQEWIAAEDWLHAREMARFYLDVVDRPELARRLAVINSSIQKEPEDLRLLRRTARLEPEPRSRAPGD